MIPASPRAPVERPLSPHLSIYKPIPTMVMSIMHRVSGAALYFGTLLLAWWLLAAASGPEAFSWASAFFGSIIGRLVLFGYTWALMLHMLGGIRHFIWDAGYCISKPASTRLAFVTAIGSAVLTLLVWAVALTVF